MRIKLLKKMYRQTNEAMKRGDVFQQRPCPFYNEMHRIFSGGDGSNNLSNSQLLDDDEEELEEEIEQENSEKISNEEKLTQAIDRLIEYQQQNEVELLRIRFSNLCYFFSFRIVGMNISNNKQILNNNVDKKIEPINFN